MADYSVGKVSEISGVSIRALHHYDKIGLLKPKRKSDSNYRSYGVEELERLQQILFYKHLEFTLSEIGELLDDPHFDRLRALKFQKIQLLQQKERIHELLKTIDQSIKNLEGDKEMKESDLYRGFSKEQVEAWNKEVDANYDDSIVAEARINIKNMSNNDGLAVKQEMENIAREMSFLLGNPVDDVRVIMLMERQHQANEQFYKTSAEIFKGLGKMYISDERFKKYYDKYGSGTAKFMSDAMTYYAENIMK